MASEEELHVAFERLRPVCVELTRNHTVDCVEALQRVIAESDIKVIIQLQEYILFPLRLIIKTSKHSSERLYERCVSVMTCVLSHTPLRQWSAFMDILSSLCCLISLPTAELTLAPVSEELKQASVSCMTTMLHQADDQLLLLLYRCDNLPLIGHIVSVLLALAQDEGNRKLKASSLKCLRLLMVHHRFQLGFTSEISRGLLQSGDQNNCGLGSDTSSNIESNHLCPICKAVINFCDIEDRISMLHLSESKVQTVNIKLSTDSDGDSKLSLLKGDERTNEVLFASSKIFSSFLPGILTAMTKIMTGDSKQGQIVIGGAVIVWSTALTLVLSDELLALEQKQWIDDQVLPEAGSARLRVRRTEEWVRVTGERVKLLLEKIVEVGFEDSWRVREAVVDMAAALLMNCIRSLQCCVTLLLDVLVRGMMDEYASVAAAARSALRVFSRARLCDESCRVIDVLKECVYALSTRLPRVMCSTVMDDVRKVSTIRLLKGYVELLGRRVNEVLLSGIHLHRLSGALMQLLVFDCSNIQLLEERTQGFTDTALTASKSIVMYRLRYHYQHFVEVRVEQEVASLCALLGQYADLQLLLDHFIDLYHQSLQYRKQAVFCMNAVLSGMSQPRCETCQANSSMVLSDEQHQVLIKSLLEEYICSLRWPLNQSTGHSSYTEQLSTELCRMNSVNSRSRDSEATIEQKNSHIILTSLLLDGIGCCATVMGSSFNYVLAEVLYPVLAMLGCENARVSRCALLALHDIARAVECTSVCEMLCSNCDYVMSAVSVRLRHVQRYPDSLVVLSVLLTHGNTHVLPLISDTMHEILEALDLHYDDMLLHFLRVFNSLVTSVFKWYCQPDIVTSTGTALSPTTWFPLASSSLPLSSTAPTSSCDPALSLASALPFLASLPSGLTSGPTSSCALLSSTDLSSATSTSSAADALLSQPTEDRCSSDLVQCTTDYHNNKLCSESFDYSDTLTNKEEFEGSISGETNDGNMTSCAAEEKGEEEKKLPLHIELVTQILERSQHLLLSSDVRIQLILLDIIGLSCRILKPNQSELLPLLHQLWKPFVKRFDCADAVVIIKAFNVLREMAGCAGDFLYKRVVTDIIPKVAQHLHRLANTSKRKESSYRHSAACRLQLCFLNNIGSLCRHVMIDVKHLNSLMLACLPYFSCYQPSCLQQACLEAFSEFMVIDSDCVWLILNDVYCPNNPLTTHIPSLKHIQMSGSSSLDEYSRNVDKLMKLL